MLRIALAACFAALGFATTAFAQTDYTIGQTPRQVLERQRAQDNVAIDPRQRPPRFIVEAISFRAADETHYEWMGSDSIFAEFWSGGRTMVTRTVEDVDSGNTEQFLSTQNCIYPAIDPDRRQNGRWQCDRAGGVGPIEFTVGLYEDDAISLPPWGFRVCGALEYRGTDVGACNDGIIEEADDRVLFATLRYEVADIIQRLNPTCRCFSQTVTSNNDDSRYQFRFRITMVDPGGGPTFEQGPVGGGGGGPTTPSVHRQGSLTAPNGTRFEFDAGSIVMSAGDLIFSRSGNFLLTPASGARIWVGNATARGYAGCAAGAANHTTNAVQLPAPGSHACYITSDGRVGELRVVELTDPPFGMPPSLTVSYTTWSN